ncbi:MAG: hypothetical protein HC781_12995 [Leptolyngbyaceae cyanobacterium CSU_1_4]|nr:hypothetical protein [Leptolyngbyaceae cyanobacterium CSU_1_4]
MSLNLPGNSQKSLNWIDSRNSDSGRWADFMANRSPGSPVHFGALRSLNFEQPPIFPLRAHPAKAARAKDGASVVQMQQEGTFRYQLSQSSIASKPGADREKQAQSRGSKLWELSSPSIINPESTYYSASSNAIFASSVVGSEVQKDGQGWISKISPQGKLLKGKWVKGLNAPHGMREHDGTLWVADIDQLVAIDIQSAKVISRTTIPGARFLNDVAIANDGKVFVSDTLKNRVYQYDQGKVTTFAKGRSLDAPNGLLVVDNQLIVAGFGQINDPELFTTTVPGHVFGIDLASQRRNDGSRKKALITKTPLGNLDGIERKKNGNFIVSDYTLGKVFFVNAKTGSHQTLLSDLRAPADIGFIPQKISF